LVEMLCPYFFGYTSASGGALISRMAGSSLQGRLQNMRGKLFLFFPVIPEKYPPVIMEKKEIANQSHHFAFQNALSFAEEKFPLIN
jgi:hypothetical protein